ncbi:hypothetical protein GCM10023339_40460 [Alloalcanivorax gelatiniphagus]
MSRAYESTVRLSLEVRGGLLVRQAHHWAALVLPASLTLQMLVSFFTGGFRRPRRSSWVLLCLVFLLTLAGGWSGYGLPDDSLAGTGLRIVEGIVVGIPVIGAWLRAALFGGVFPGVVVTRLYWIHVVVVPLALLAIIGLRLRLAYRERPQQMPRSRQVDDDRVGLPWAAAFARATGMATITVGLLVAMGGMLSIAPVWLYGPSSASSASAGSQPDWYTSFLDGALRLVPPGWEIDALGGTWPIAILLPQVVAAAFLTVVLVYPFLEEVVTRDRRQHHVLDRPRDAPNRTGLGVAGLTFYGSLWAAGATDIVTTQFGIAFELQVRFLWSTLTLGSVAAFFVTRWVCLGLQAKDSETEVHGVETGIIRRAPTGAYLSQHKVPIHVIARRPSESTNAVRRAAETTTGPASGSTTAVDRPHEATHAEIVVERREAS